LRRTLVSRKVLPISNTRDSLLVVSRLQWRDVAAAWTAPT